MTTRLLVLIRHAKAAAEGETDAERALAGRGRADAPAIGSWLAQQRLAPDRIVLSPARRAIQTWQLAAPALGGPPVPVIDERVYGNTVDDLLQVIRTTPAGVDTLVLVGHNPSIEELAGVLDNAEGDAVARGRLAEKCPASAVAVFKIRPDWAAVGPGSGALALFAVPRG